MAIQNADIALSLTDIKKSIEARKDAIIESATIVKETIIITDKQYITEIDDVITEIRCPNNTFTEHFRNQGFFLESNTGLISEGSLILESGEDCVSKILDYRKDYAYANIEVNIIGENLDDLVVWIDYGNGFQDITANTDNNRNDADRFDSKFSENESKGIRLYSVPFENKLRYKLENTGSTQIKINKLTLRWWYR